MSEGFLQTDIEDKIWLLTRTAEQISDVSNKVQSVESGYSVDNEERVFRMVLYREEKDRIQFVSMSGKDQPLYPVMDLVLDVSRFFMTGELNNAEDEVLRYMCNPKLARDLQDLIDLYIDKCGYEQDVIPDSRSVQDFMDDVLGDDDNEQ